MRVEDDSPLRSQTKSLVPPFSAGYDEWLGTCENIAVVAGHKGRYVGVTFFADEVPASIFVIITPHENPTFLGADKVTGARPCLTEPRSN